VNYKGWPNCYRISNDTLELMVTTDVGPRIIRFGFVGQDNEFKEYDAQLGRTGDSVWNIYGGHRLWHAPEADPRTYFPDNHPVRLTDHDGFVRLIQPLETTTGIAKEMDVALDPSQARVRVTHRLRNEGLWPVKLAPWALSVMNTGGTCIVPLPPRGTHPEHLLPANTLTLWRYTNMSDPRWTWGNKYILLRQDPTPSVKPQKIGASVPDGWIAYARKGHLFVVRFPFVASAEYTDHGCCVETFTNHEMLEVETLGPTVELAPSASVEHVETWHLFDKVPVPASDSDVEQHVLPRVRET
jgi:hypothetical protein